MRTKIRFNVRQLAFSNADLATHHILKVIETRAPTKIVCGAAHLPEGVTVQYMDAVKVESFYDVHCRHFSVALIGRAEVGLNPGDLHSLFRFVEDKLGAIGASRDPDVWPMYPKNTKLDYILNYPEVLEAYRCWMRHEQIRTVTTTGDTSTVYVLGETEWDALSRT